MHLHESDGIAVVWDTLHVDESEPNRLVLCVEYAREVMGYDTSVKRPMLWGPVVHDGRERFDPVVSVLLELPAAGEYVCVMDDVVTRLSTLGKEPIVSFTSKIVRGGTSFIVLRTATRTYVHALTSFPVLRTERRPYVHTLTSRPPFLAIDTAALDASIASAHARGLLDCLEVDGMGLGKLGSRGSWDEMFGAYPSTLYYFTQKLTEDEQIRMRTIPKQSDLTPPHR